MNIVGLYVHNAMLKDFFSQQHMISSKNLFACQDVDSEPYSDILLVEESTILFVKQRELGQSS